MKFVYKGYLVKIKVTGVKNLKGDPTTVPPQASLIKACGQDKNL